MISVIDIFLCMEMLVEVDLEDGGIHQSQEIVFYAELYPVII